MRYIIFILLIFAALLISACQRHVGDNLGQRSLEQSEIPHDLGYKSDFNQDCSVDLDDFFLLVDEINNFQSKDAVTLDYLYDLNGDSWVDREDFTLFSKAYGFKCEKIYPEDFEDCKPNQCSILIILDKNLEILLSDEINQFKADIQSDLDGYDVFVYIPNSNPTKEDVKAVIMQYYHDHYLKGAILVGDIPSAKYMDFSNSEYNRNFFFSQGYMVSDAYYRDIEGRSSVVKDGLIDLSKNKVGKYLNGLKPPFWIGRLTPPNNMNRVQALRNYFKKNHEYRTKSLSFEKRLLLYSPINVEFYPTLPEDDALMESYGSQIDLLKSYGVYENEDVTLMGYSKSPYYTDAIKEPYEYAFIESHGSPDTLYPGVTSDMIKNSNPLFYTFTGCSVGDFLNPNYISGYHLFNGNTLFVKACSIVHFDGDELEVPYLFALKNGVPIFKAQDLSTRGNMCYAWLGDPTLRMRDPVRDAAGDVPRIAFSVKQISLGDVTASYSLDEGYGNFKIFNDGNLPLIVYSISTRNTQNFYYVDIRLKDNKGMSINNLIIPSKQSREFQFFILPTDNDSVAGELLGEAYTLSNDPANPLVSLHYSGGVTKIIKEKLDEQNNDKDVEVVSISVGGERELWGRNVRLEKINNNGDLSLSVRTLRDVAGAKISVIYQDIALKSNTQQEIQCLIISHQETISTANVYLRIAKTDKCEEPVFPECSYLPLCEDRERTVCISDLVIAVQRKEAYESCKGGCSGGESNRWENIRFIPCKQPERCKEGSGLDRWGQKGYICG